jgi:hypothetical protein
VSTDRLTDALIASGFPPTPEGLARAAKSEGISLEDAREVFQICAIPPRGLLAFAKVCRALKVRMVYIISGDTVPQLTGTLTKDDARALTILSGLDPEERRKWLRTGMHMVKD